MYELIVAFHKYELSWLDILCIRCRVGQHVAHVQTSRKRGGFESACCVAINPLGFVHSSGHISNLSHFTSKDFVPRNISYFTGQELFSLTVMFKF